MEEDSAPRAVSSYTLSPATTLGVSLSRLGAPSQCIKTGTLQELADLDEAAYGEPLHAMIIVGKRLHPLEVDYAKLWAVGEGWLKISNDAYGVNLEH
ncbi:diphthine synthase [Tulasnella sp. 419]|nr:diphthine synthase [Tulasnella sp. 419]